MSILYWIFLLIDSVVYNFINYAYQIFLLLSRVVLADEEIISPFIQRVYTIIGVVMLFIVAYSFLKAIVNPENNVKSMGQTIFSIVKAIVLLALIPSAFDFAYTVQNSILDQNTIGRIILGGSDSKTNPADVINNGGLELSRTMIQAFIFPKGGKDAGTVKIEGDMEYSLQEIWDAIVTNKTFRYLTMLSEELGLDSASEIDYQVLISTGAACYILYLLISYCLSLGLRVIKLLFYEVISPIPILASILPNKKDMFNKWLSVTITTFIEVFLRIGIMYLTVYIASLVPTIELIQKQSGPVGFLANACILMGLFSFVKKAPELIAEVTGIDSSKMGTGIKEQLKSGGFFAAGGALGAAGISGARRLIGAGRNMRENIKTNSKGWKTADGKGKARIAGKVAKNIGAGLAGMTFGTAASALRGAKGGFSTESGSFKDMKGKISDTYKAESARVGKAQDYNAKHGGVLGGIGGHITDGFRNVGGVLGIGGLDALQAQKKTLADIGSKRKAIQTAAFDTIDGEIAKGNSSLEIKDASGNVLFSANELRQQKTGLEAIRNAGRSRVVVKDANGNDTYDKDGKLVERWETDDEFTTRINSLEKAYLDKRKAFADAIQNHALSSKNDLDKLSLEYKNNIDSVISAAKEFRTAVNNNLTNSAVADAGYTVATKDTSWSVTDSTSPTKNIGDKVKEHTRIIDDKIKKINSKTDSEE